MKRILTVPTELSHNPRVLYTGNHYLSLPEIDPEDAAVQSLNLISLAHKGLVEVRGEEGVFRPSFWQGGRRLAPDRVQAELEAWFIPSFRFFFPGRAPVEVKICPDLRERGLVWLFASSEPVEVRLACRVDRLAFLRFHAHEVEFRQRCGRDPWLGNPVLEVRGPGVAFALAFGAERTEGAEGTEEAEGAQAGEGFSYQWGEGQGLTLALPCRGEAAVYVAVNADPDGASTTLVHLRRKDYRRIYEEFREWLEGKAIRLPGEPFYEGLLNQNLFFNYFFALGKDFASDQYVALTSRSPRYYVSGAFWERDTFLWSLPAVKLVDPELAKEVAREMILRHSKNAGEHAHYIDGTVLYPGFELDEAASYLIRAEDFGPEEADPELLRAFDRVLRRVEQEYDPEAQLYRTFLLPSDDPSAYPFVTIDQAILIRGFQNLAGLYRWLGREEEAARLLARCREVREGVWRHLVREVDGQRIFVWSADARGHYLLYNDPPGNLGLLPFYGFIDPGDEVFRHTIAYYYSPRYRYYDPDAAIGELACDHHPRTPSGLGLCGSLLNPLLRERALAWLRKAPMDHGLLAESFDKNTGEARTGVGFATGAGYLALALYCALVKEEGPEGAG